MIELHMKIEQHLSRRDILRLSAMTERLGGSLCIRKEGRTVAAGSVLGLLTLDLRKDDEITVIDFQESGGQEELSAWNLALMLKPRAG